MSLLDLVLVPRLLVLAGAAGAAYALLLRAFAATSVRSDAESVVARYPEGREVVVYYNRARPSDAILERNVAPPRGTPLLLGSSLLVVVGVVWWYAM